MREILFRGKRKDNGEWVYGSLVKRECGCFIYYETPDEFCQIGNWLDSVEVIPETVGQYTGLKDKDGRKIFEGDVTQIDIEPGGAWHFPKRYEICYEDEDTGAFTHRVIDKNHAHYGHAFADPEDGMLPTWMRIIGNIHDNPELLDPKHGVYYR